MNTSMKKITVFLLIISLFCGILPSVDVFASVQTDVTGMLTDTWNPNDDTFTLSGESRLFVIADLEPEGDLLQTVQLLQRQFAAAGCPATNPMPLVWGQEEWVSSGDIVIDLDTDSKIGAEGYRLEVTEIARVVASDVDGLLYGGNRLLKQLRIAGSHSMQGFLCEDTPDTLQRVVSLDCGRKYYTANWICNFIRELSWMGYNTLELHFSDDSGFRMDLWDETYYTDTYRPANDFSWICGSNYTSWTLSAYKNDPDQGKYLTTAEVIGILETAKEYHIDVIPAFDSPSHLDYLTWTYEQNYKTDPSYSFYSTYDSKTYDAKDVQGIINYTNSSGWTTPLKWPYYSTVNVVSDHAKAFIFELYQDIADFFKTYAGSTDFSIGADEVNLSTYNLASGYSFTWGFPDFVNYINELNGLLNRKGYTMRMYNDFMGSTTYQASGYDFADNIKILYWDSPFEPNTGGPGTNTEPVSYFVEQGSTIYNCIQTNTYYALRITGDGSDARSIYNRQWTFYHSNEEDIYDEWYPANFSEHGDYSEDTEDVPSENLGGAYFLIWCDYACVSTEAQIWNGCYDATTKNTGEFYSLRDRMWSNITKMWNWDVNETVTFDAFVKLRDGYGDFPGCGTGLNACSEKTVLPAATQISSVYVAGCKAYTSYCQVQAVCDSRIMSLPCSASPEGVSILVEAISAQEAFTAVGLYENEAGELWYKVKTGTGKMGYLNAHDTQFISVLSDDLTITDTATPSGHVQGQTFALAGEIQSIYHAVTSAQLAVFSGFVMDGDPVISEQIVASGNKISLQGSTMAFEELPIGEYTYSIVVSYQSYYVNNGEITKLTDDFRLIEKRFLVLETAVDQMSCSHSYRSDTLHPASCMEEGKMLYYCTNCGHVYEEVMDVTGHDYSETILHATCLEYETVRYTCTSCGYSYDVYSESAYSQWQEMKPEEVAEELLQVQELYRYSDYETTVSTDPELEGYTQAGVFWEKQMENTVCYVPNWPLGFDQSSDLYAQYNQVDSKVTAFETDTDQRVVDSDNVTGYLYYHWCYANSYYSISYESGSYTTFHAYYSTVEPSNYICDYSDMSYCTAHSTCTNSQWFFVTPVNTQKYTDYSKMYHYERWSDWSDWSDIPAEATNTRKVETKTFYRYVTGPLADHQWNGGVCTVCALVCEHKMENGVCAVCGEVCDHRFQNNQCLFCGFEKPVLDLCLFGYINGIDYGCEENSEIPEEFRFVNGQLILFVSQDSKVAVRSVDAKYCYLTDGGDPALSSAHVYNVNSIEEGGMLDIPGNMLVTFTLEDHGDDTYQLSFHAIPCPHEAHSPDGECLVCKETVDHIFLDGFCECGFHCEHNWLDGVCTECAAYCAHAMHDVEGNCINCGCTVDHHYEAEVTEPSCTLSGFTTFTCCCGHTYTADENEAIGHDYSNGVCILCGETEPVVLPSVSLLYPALSFEDEVRIHVFFKGEKLENAAEIGMIIYSEEVPSWSIETAESVVLGYQESQDAGIYYCSTNGIHAKALGDRLYFSVYYRTQDGEYVYSALRNYSPADYAYNHLENPSTSAEVKALVVAMLNYGAAAQRYFAYHSDCPVNAGLSDEQKAMVMEYAPTMIAPVQKPDGEKNGEFQAVSDSFTKKRPAVSFKGAFAIEYFFTPAHTPNGDVKLYYWNQEDYQAIDSCSAENATGVLTMTFRDDGQHHASVEGISAKDLDQTVFAAAVYSDGTTNYCSGILSYHIGSYCSSFASYENDARELAAATAVYGYYAKMCFNN